MLRKIVFAFLILGFLGKSNAQCTIKAPRNACIDDLVTFSITTSLGAISSYFWNFGAYGNSTNTSPIVKFTASGTVIAKCTITLAAGGTCIDTHSIVISANPLAKVTLDASSDSCLAKNQICMKTQFQKGGKGFSALNILWGDGNLSTLSPPFLPKLCHNYTDTGTFAQTLELTDSVGCKNIFNTKIHVVPSVKAVLSKSIKFGCDSSRICFSIQADGGNKIKYNWYAISDGKKVGSTAIFCKYANHNQPLNYKFLAMNEFGCKDSLIADTFAPDSFAFFDAIPRRQCISNLLMNPLSLHTLYPRDRGSPWAIATWFYNGKSLGKTSGIVINNGNPGWNYIKMTVATPCPRTYTDSFWLTIIKAKAKVYNEFQRKPFDTVWFQDISKNDPGSKITRWWDFNDSFGNTCTTWTKYKMNVKGNCNFSKDSMAWHRYMHKQCPIDVRLTIYDSTTDCYDETFLSVTDTEFCKPIAPNTKKICLGEPTHFDINYGLWKKIRYKNYILTDIGKKHDSIIFDAPSIEYFYETPGKKSPIFHRYIPPDTIYTLRNGKVEIDFIKPAIGWVVDTFKNYVEVLYKPNGGFTLKKLGNCNPSKLQLNFDSSKWLYPQGMHISWGDDSSYNFTGYGQDTSAKLQSFEHTYKKTGYYTVIVTLTPRNGCTHTHVESMAFGYDVRFGFKIPCTSNVCFTDTARELFTTNNWTKAGGQGRLVWDFGDGKKDSGFSMCHSYKLPGVYRVKLKAVSKEGCSDTTSRVVRIGLAKAGIKKQPQIYCSEIRKYFDSSVITGFKDSAQIVKWSWYFGDGTNTVFVKNPAHYFPSGGVYRTRLIITTNKGCTDTTYRDFNVMGPLVKAAIIGDSLGCAPFTAKFANLSKQTSKYIWKFGDSNNMFYSTLKDTNVAFKYLKPGVYYVHLTGGDSFYNPVTKSHYYCSATYPDSLGKYQIKINVNQGYHSQFTGPDTVCTSDTAVFQNNSDSSFIKQTVWLLGNGVWFIKPFGNLKYKYPQPGNFKVQLYAYNIHGTKLPCLDTATRKITVLDINPDFEPDCDRTNAPVFYFKNLTEYKSQQYLWSLKNPRDSAEKVIALSRDLSYNFGVDTLNRTICLRYNGGKFCRTKVCKNVVLVNNVYLANVFSPGTDGLNDNFKVPLYGYHDFHLQIFNRWGEKIFNSTDPKFEWNGKVQNTGPELPTGTYFYQLKYRDECGDKKLKTLSGSINLYR